MVKQPGLRGAAWTFFNTGDGGATMMMNLEKMEPLPLDLCGMSGNPPNREGRTGQADGPITRGRSAEATRAIFHWRVSSTFFFFLVYR